MITEKKPLYIVDVWKSVDGAHLGTFGHDQECAQNAHFTPGASAPLFPRQPTG